jgi:hypothetical protein
MATGAEQLAELQRRRGAGELSPHDLDFSFLYELNETGGVLKRSDLDHPTGPQAVVLDRQAMEALGSLTFVSAKHGEMTINEQSLTDDLIVIFPEEVGG